jgi:thiol-disulfide isomerase/thioredoxin
MNIKNYRIFNRRVVSLLTLVFAVVAIANAQSSQNSKDSVLVLSGKFYGKNIHVFQKGLSTKLVKVNGKELNDSVFAKSSMYLIDLKSYHFKEQEPIKIEIVYDVSKGTPVNMNPYALQVNPLLNAKLPPLIAKDINGKEINTTALIGQVVVINTWFVGCKPCAVEMPALNKVKEKYENKDVVFIALSLTAEEKIKEFLLEHPFNYSIIANSTDYCKNVLKCEGYPYNIVVNKKGEVVYIALGADEGIEAILTKEIEKAF